MEVKNLVMDTNAFSKFVMNDQHLTNMILNAPKILFPYIVLAELKSGFLLGNRYTSNMAILNEFCSMDKLIVLYPNTLTTDYYADIFKILKLKGKPIPTNDIWIAALTIQHHGQLLTFEKHFEYIDGLIIISP